MHFSISTSIKLYIQIWLLIISLNEVEASRLPLKKKKSPRFLTTSSSNPERANGAYTFKTDGADPIVGLGKDNTNNITEKNKGIYPDKKLLFDDNASHSSHADRAKTARYLATFSNPSNIALGKTATQNGSASNAMKAIDGNTDGNLANGSVNHTDGAVGAYSWWQVDLGAEYWINQLVIYNRTDNMNGGTWGHRLNTATVQFIDTDGVTVLHSFPLGVVGNSKTWSSINLKCQVVKLVNQNIIHIAELQLNGYLYQYPSVIPSVVPSKAPSANPSAIPSKAPSANPSAIPSKAPSANPSGAPSLIPSATPSAQPSISPTDVPTMIFTTKYPSPDPSAVPSITQFVEQTTTLYLALSGNLSDLQNLSLVNMQKMASSVADYLLSQPLLALEAATVEMSFYGSSKVGEQSVEQIRTFLTRRLQTDGAIRLVLDVQSTTRVVNSSNMDGRMSELIRSDTEGFSRAITSSVDGSLDSLTGLIANLEDIHPSTSPSSVPSVRPSSHPSREPSSMPSSRPTLIPSIFPSSLPSSGPLSSLSSSPSSSPSSKSSSLPSSAPSSLPSLLKYSNLPSSPSSSRPPFEYIPSNKPSFTSSLYPSFKSVDNTKTDTSSMTPSNVTSREPKNLKDDNGSGGSIYVRKTTLAGVCAAASAAAASASAGSAAASASASIAPSDEIRTDSKNPQKSVTQAENARVEGGTATLSKNNQKRATKRLGYNDDDEEEADQTTQFSVTHEEEMSRSIDCSQLDSNQGVSSAGFESYDQYGSDIINDYSFTDGNFEQGTLSEPGELNRAQAIDDKIELVKDIETPDMKYSEVGSFEISNNQEPIAEIKSARVEGGTAALSNQNKNKDTKAAKNRKDNLETKSKQLNENETDGMSMTDKLQVASGGLEDGYDSSWKDKYDSNKRSMKKLSKKIANPLVDGQDDGYLHLVCVSFSVAVALFRLSYLEEAFSNSKIEKISRKSDATLLEVKSVSGAREEKCEGISHHREALVGLRAMDVDICDSSVASSEINSNQSIVPSGSFHRRLLQDQSNKPHLNTQEVADEENQLK